MPVCSISGVVNTRRGIACLMVRRWVPGVSPSYMTTLRRCCGRSAAFQVSKALCCASSRSLLGKMNRAWPRCSTASAWYIASRRTTPRPVPVGAIRQTCRPCCSSSRAWFWCVASEVIPWDCMTSVSQGWQRRRQLATRLQARQYYRGGLHHTPWRRSCSKLCNKGGNGLAHDWPYYYRQCLQRVRYIFYAEAYHLMPEISKLNTRWMVGSKEGCAMQQAKCATMSVMSQRNIQALCKKEPIVWHAYLLPATTASPSPSRQRLTLWRRAVAGSRGLVRRLS